MQFGRAGRRVTRVSVVWLLVEHRLPLAIDVSSVKIKPWAGQRNIPLRSNPRTDVRRHVALLRKRPRRGLCRSACPVRVVLKRSQYSRRFVVFGSLKSLQPPAAKKVSSRERQIAHLKEQLHHPRRRIDKQSESVRKHSEQSQLTVDKLECLKTGGDRKRSSVP